jgi:hypothetical protein
MNEEDLKNVTRLRFAPPWDELSLRPVTGLIRLNLWLAQHLHQPERGCRMVEIGSHAGESASIFATFPMWTNIALVDAWLNKPAYLLCSRRMQVDIDAGRVTLHRSLSVDAASDAYYPAVCAAGPPHFVYIDAAHDYDSVRDDLAAWYPKLAPGGLIGGHDYSSAWPGVTQAVNEFMAAHSLGIVTFPDGSYVLRNAIELKKEDM